MEKLEFALGSKLEPASGGGTCVPTPGLKGPIKCEGTEASERKGVLVHRLHQKKKNWKPTHYVKMRAVVYIAPHFRYGYHEGV